MHYYGVYTLARAAGLNVNTCKIIATASEFVDDNIGHGAVHTYPDRPYLKWRFKYEDGRESGERFNPDTFLEACEKLHTFFIRFAQASTDYRERPPTQFSDMKDKIIDVLALTKPVENRIQAWKDLMASGRFFEPETIPKYNVNNWLDELNSVENLSDSSGALKLDAFKFLQAIAIHRSYVLRDLLPEHGLLVR